MSAPRKFASLSGRATSAMAPDEVRRIREVADLPIKYLVPMHHRAARGLRAISFNASQGHVLLCGDWVEFDAVPCAGEARFNDSPQVLTDAAALTLAAWLPARGPALTRQSAGERRPVGHRQFHRRCARQWRGRRGRSEAPEGGRQAPGRNAQAQPGAALAYVQSLRAVPRDARQ